MTEARANNWFGRHPILTVVCALISLVILVSLLALIFGDGGRVRREDEVVKANIDRYVDGLNRGTFGTVLTDNSMPFYTLQNQSLLKLLSNNGAKWEVVIRGRACILTGWIRGDIWRSLFLETKENLIKNILVNLHHITSDKYQEIIIKDRYNGRELASYSPWTGIKIRE